MGSLSKTKAVVDIKTKPHAVCIPFPAQGHINPMLQLAKILHSRGFHITFVNNEFNHNRLLRSRGPNAVDGLPSFRFETITDGLPHSDNADATQDVVALAISMEQHSLVPFRQMLARLNDTASTTGDVPPVSCIVSDVTMFFTLDAAEELGVPEVMLWTASACGLLGYAQYQKLIDLGLVPFQDSNFLTNGDLERVLDWVSGMPGIRMKDIPSFIRTTDPDDIVIGFLQRCINNSKRASTILFNSFDALERDVLLSLSTNFPPLYTLGPLHFLLDNVEGEGKTTQSICSNLWKEDLNCLDWLDSYEPDSVIYVNFGSVTVITNDQLLEFAWGLANSKQPFLWITRPDLISGHSAVLPSEFMEETRRRGFIASWCNQERVLAHPAIGGFLTHCGWNSTVESICNEVPMICWPFFAEQQTNCWYCCTKWGIGMEIDSNVKRNEVEMQVRELMGGDKGKEMKRNVRKCKALAHQATIPIDGSSYANLDTLITKVLLS